VQDFDFIETPENVELQRRLAGIGTRFIAGLIDNLLIGLMYLVLFLFLVIFDMNIAGKAGIESPARIWALTLVIIIAFAIYWGYFVFFEMRTNGQSPGKKFMKIRVVQMEGTGISFNAIAIRNLLRAVDMIGLYAIAGISMFFTQKMQRLGDLAAGTVVVSEELPNYSAYNDQKRQVLDNEAITPGALEATGLKPQEYRLLNNYWLRREELSLEVRSRLLPQLVRPVLSRLGRTLPDESLDTLEYFVAEILTMAINARQQTTKINDTRKVDR